VASRGATLSLLDALRSTLAVEPIGEPVGNLSMGKGALGGRAVRLAALENRIASGSIGKAEVAKLAPLFAICAREKSPLVLYLDSAGARISEGLDALGAFRRLFREGLAAATAGAPIAVALGRNCYGGASMLAHLGQHRLFSPSTQLAMSGPSILASVAGADPLDEMFRTMVGATIGPVSRAKAAQANVPWTPDMDLAAWLRDALAPVAGPWGAFHARHKALRARLEKGITTRASEAIRRKDLDRLYQEGYEATECDGVIQGKAIRAGTPTPILGLVGNKNVGAERAWRFADAAWRIAKDAPPRLAVLLDCESHAARLEDEKSVLSEYIVDMGVALAAAASRGSSVELTILDRAGGGVYAALAAAATRISVVYGADIQVLPGSAVASILGENRESVGDILEYRRAGVADDEIKLGLPP
jgi:hypothetical protein